ncbi:hypothetical protein COT78_00250 [Candidatus Berkelbacteria bacterium CG10_big_fil_rev_8_21_14_0_10_43_13]|uniref:Lipoprotein n=1 Tax=Candidatus Berkelbacteria bacterium CG10_big_fil_rev_8_21_14_0_10_43_13 TaxID=1974514 RepID=A0A2H0W7J6_9BACT|nr:MAG: hypothetical protein COT78_00250 [Candidatus Berkelbacteria bacterium CG10_big_fil_rev_8_21_14_0_10_43_13]
MRKLWFALVVSCVLLTVGCSGGGGGSTALTPAENDNNANDTGNADTTDDSSTTDNSSSESKDESFYIKFYSSDPWPSSTSLTLGVFSDELVLDGKYKTEACRNLHGNGSALWISKDVSLPDPPSYLEGDGQARCCLMIWYDNDYDGKWNYQTERLERQVKSNSKVLGLIYDSKYDPGNRWWICYYDTRELIAPANGYSLSLILN